MQYSISRNGKVIRQNIVLPTVPILGFLNGLVEQGVVEKGDVLRTEPAMPWQVQYTGNRKWKSLIMRKGVSLDSLKLKAPTLEKLQRRGITSIERLLQMTERTFLNEFGRVILRDVQEGFLLAGHPGFRTRLASE